MSRSRAHELMAEAFGLPASDITADMAISTTPQWDSIAHTRLILALEAEIGRQLGAEEIFAIATAADVGRVIQIRR